MDILKRNLFFIICGLTATVGIALAAVGLKSMTGVQSRMVDAGRLLGQLDMAQRNPVNKRAIDDMEKRVETIKSNYQGVTNWAHNLNRRAPLIPDFFPDAPVDKKQEFTTAYVATVDGLLESLKSGTPPTPREIDDMRETIENEKPRQRDPFQAGKENAEEGEKGNRSGLITNEQARSHPAARASLVKAQRTRCYANLDSLDLIEEMYLGGIIEIKPGVFWDAQRKLWVQQDVIEALARVNKEAATKLEEAGHHPWVGVLPVKDVLSIRISNYVFGDSTGKTPARASDDGPAEPPARVNESFTACESNSLYDVLHFTVKLVVDPRQIPGILDAICKNRFYIPLRVDYVTQPPNLSMTGKIYGEDPAVRVVVDFEAYYLGDVYRRLMPKSILDEIAQERPEDEEKPED
ncbi:MAG: hypothetical protein KAV82_05900 [Phycisphaerae bacterium]|nr:hypothetical protein [Phycisphaerae bacterium]